MPSYELKRMWINQPSTLDKHHKLHAKNVLAGPKDDQSFAQIWFTEGAVISMVIHTFALSEGWTGQK